MKDIIYNKMTDIFCILNDKINLGLPLNDFDKSLFYILDLYDFLIDYIDYEEKKGKNIND